MRAVSVSEAGNRSDTILDMPDIDGPRSSGRNDRVLHLFDAADVGRILVDTAQARALPWDFLAMRDTSRDRSGTLPAVATKARAGAWEAARATRALRSDVIHLHYGARASALKKRPRRPFVLHLHGTDIRELWLLPRVREVMQWAGDRAQSVFYSTPDLASHSHELRADAEHLPGPVQTSLLPSWNPGGTGRSRVVFASRWDDSKNAVEMIATATALRAAFGDQVVIEGLDWGTRTTAAREAGVVLVPRSTTPEYLRWLALADAVIGQAAGILALSELQAMAIGVPVVARVDRALYPDAPVIATSSTDDDVEAVRGILEDPVRTSASLMARAWVVERHDPDRLVDRLLPHYRRAADGDGWWKAT